VQLPPLAPLFTSLTLSVVCGICARSHHQVSEDADTFTFSPVVGYLFVGVGILFCALPWLARRDGDQPPSDFFWHWSPIWLLIFAGAAFFFRYRVVVRDQTLTFGAFRRRAVPFSEVIDYDEIQGQRSAELWVYLKNGKHLTFSGLLGDFDELVGMVNSHMAGLPGPQHDSAAKVRDRERRQRGNRVANWLAVVGVLIVAAFVLILWRMQLLH
jgi:hypothetical protein